MQMRLIAGEQKLNVNDLMAAGRRIAKGINFSGSIDDYIHTHQHNELIKICGKLGIVQTIVEYEKKSKLFIDTNKRPHKFRDENGVLQSWLSKFMVLLQSQIIAETNLDHLFKNVMIINFNYDRCIEQFLYHALQDLYGVDGNRASKLIGSLRIFHPYGTVAPLPWQHGDGGLHFGGNPGGYHTELGRLIDNIRTYNEEVEEGRELAILRQIFAASKRFVFLGFHFHKQNLELITPPEMKEDVDIFATALNRSASDVEVIKERMTHVFGVSVSYGPQHYETSMDCTKLFTDFRAKFVSG